MNAPPNHEKRQRFVDIARTHEAIATLVVHPCDRSSIEAAIDAAKLKLIRPILVGPRPRIDAIAGQFDLDISPYECVDVPHSHAAAAKAVELIRQGQAEALMKGSLHTDELMAEVVSRSSGLCTTRRISHCFAINATEFDTPIVISDAAVNIAPTLEEKADIVRNAIDFAHALGVTNVRVAILSAIETVNSRIASTVDAAALSKMAERGQITGAIVDGPLALDDAINPEAARIKQFTSPVAGHANVLIVPNIEAGNMLVKSLTYLSHADGAGIVVGASVPIILTGRADPVVVRLASCAVAVLVATASRDKAH